jgi:hypothetical protein
LVEQPYAEKEFFHVASVVDDVATYGRKQQKLEGWLGLIKEA